MSIYLFTLVSPNGFEPLPHIAASPSSGDHLTNRNTITLAKLGENYKSRLTLSM